MSPLDIERNTLSYRMNDIDGARGEGLRREAYKPDGFNRSFSLNVKKFKELTELDLTDEDGNSIVDNNKILTDMEILVAVQRGIYDREQEVYADKFRIDYSQTENVEIVRINGNEIVKIKLDITDTEYRKVQPDIYAKWLADKQIPL